MYAVTEGPNMKWGHRFQMGGRTPLVPALATALSTAGALSHITTVVHSNSYISKFGSLHVISEQITRYC